MADRKKRLKRQNLLVLIVCAALVTVGVVLLFFSLFAIYKVYDIAMELEVAERSGFNTDTEMIDFGMAEPGHQNSRTIVIAHEYKRPLLVHFKKSGNISRFVKVPEDFYLEPGLTKELTITARVPETARLGNYEGNLRVYLRRI